MGYFQRYDHRLVESAPVIPFDDPTILFINAGMNQFKDVFTGQRKRDFPRATSSQKCIRAGGKHNDLDNVGFTARHHTFFEMLGNFSFGDYFKEEAIKYCWEWVASELKLPKDRLYATVYEEDDEAFALWEKIAPELRNGRVMRFGKKDNYWSMGDIGPCGPCSELHYDRGKKFGTGPEDVVNGETERFVEIWNLVFMQFEQTADNRLIDLPAPSVDTGAGLERIAAIMQKVDSNYDIDIFQNLIKTISDLTGAKYEDNVASHNVVADHIRALTFAIADGAGISNEGRGYVLRRILRRAARHGRELGMHEPFLHRLVPVLVDEMGETYPEIREKQDFVTSVIKAEEESFGRTLDTGCDLFAEIARQVKARGQTVVPGGDVFKLYDTYGFPYDLTEVIAAEQGLTLDLDGFDKAMAAQQERSRAGASFESHQWAIEDVLGKSQLNIKEKTQFVGYDCTTTSASIRQVLQVETAEDPAHVTYAIIQDKTPFYAESGGQISDVGFIRAKNVQVTVDNVSLFQGWYFVHYGRLSKGTFEDLKELMVSEDRLNDESFVEARLVTAEVDAERRWDIMRNHTATHLAHAALHQVLGDHARQSGSYVGPDRLRFDFSHHQPMTSDEIAEVERIVNKQILLAAAVTTEEMSPEKAKKRGAMALFGEKYGEIVRVVSVADFSMELCGGTHVTNTAEIGPFFITVETGIASGVRRMEAITGREAEKKIEEREEIVRVITDELACAESDLVTEVHRLLDENAVMQKKALALRSALVSGQGLDAVGQLEASGPPVTESDLADIGAGLVDGDDRIGFQLKRKRVLQGVCALMNCTESELIERARRLAIDHRQLRNELEKLKAQVEADEGKTVGVETNIGSVQLWTHDFGETDRETLSAWIDSRKELQQPVVALAIGIPNGKPTVMLAASARAVAAGSVHAGNLLKELLSAFGGRGGGKPTFAQGGLPAGAASKELIAKLGELLR